MADPISNANQHCYCREALCPECKPFVKLDAERLAECLEALKVMKERMRKASGCREEPQGPRIQATEVMGDEDAGS